MEYEIIYKTPKIHIEKRGNQYYLHIRKPSKDSLYKYADGVRYQIDLDSVGLIQGMLDDGMRIDARLCVYNQDGKRSGNLKQYIVCHYYDIPLENLLFITFQKRWGCYNRYDLRVNNLFCAPIPTRERISLKVLRKYDDLICIYKPDGSIYATDYSPDMDRVLRSDWINWSTIARDKRLSGSLDFSILYFYQLRMIEHLYGLPATKEEFVELHKRYRSEHAGLSIDHLDQDSHNNRLSNLFMMDISTNKRKGNLLKKVQLPYFWESERIDDNTIHVRAGCGKTVTVEGDYSLDEYMDTLTQFTAEIEADCQVG